MFNDINLSDDIPKPICSRIKLFGVWTMINQMLMSIFPSL